MPFDDKTYYINYVMNLIPHAHFAFHNGNINLNGEDPIISLNLGRKYRCYTPCIDKSNDIKIDYRNTHRELKLEFKRKETRMHPSDHSFTLISIKDIRVEQGLAIGFIVASLMSIILILKEITETKNGKNNTRSKN